MSLFSGPEEHAANPPSTWTVERVSHSSRIWALKAAGTTLETYPTKAKAEAGRTDSHAAKLYAKEARWYAGEFVYGWKPYAEVKAERERTRQFLARMRTHRVWTAIYLAARHEGALSAARAWARQWERMPAKRKR